MDPHLRSHPTVDSWRFPVIIADQALAVWTLWSAAGYGKGSRGPGDGSLVVGAPTEPHRFFVPRTPPARW